MFGLFKSRNTITRSEALAALPVQLVKCTLEETSDGGARIRVPLKQGGFLGKFVRLPEGATKTFELDALGLFVWKSCDGRTSVEQIICRLAREQGLTEREVEVATVRFLQTLVRKGLVGMCVEKKK